MGNGTGEPSGLVRAAKGQKVVVTLDYIKADRREQAERFYDLFWHHPPSWPADNQLARDSSRLLYPTEANADGTYTYSWLFDPYIEGGDYNILSILTKIYGAEKGEEYYHWWREAHASDQVAHILAQT